MVRKVDVRDWQSIWITLRLVQLDLVLHLWHYFADNSWKNLKRPKSMAITGRHMSESIQQGRSA
jgi:hypothetical protein